MRIMLDMDGVVADFNKFAKSVLTNPYPDNITKYPDEEWNKLKQIDRLYRDLEVKPGAYELVDWCTNYCKNTNNKLFFLTAAPIDDDMPWAFYDKVLWAQKYFPDIPVFFGPKSKDKYKHYKDGDILIDDRSCNITDWHAVGGRAHQYTTWDLCKPWLIETLGNL